MTRCRQQRHCPAKAKHTSGRLGSQAYLVAEAIRQSCTTPTGLGHNLADGRCSMGLAQYAPRPGHLGVGFWAIGRRAHQHRIQQIEPASPIRFSGKAFRQVTPLVAEQVFETNRAIADVIHRQPGQPVHPQRRQLHFKAVLPARMQGSCGPLTRTGTERLPHPRRPGVCGIGHKQRITELHDEHRVDAGDLTTVHGFVGALTKLVISVRNPGQRRVGRSSHRLPCCFGGGPALEYRQASHGSIVPQIGEQGCRVPRHLPLAGYLLPLNMICYSECSSPKV